VQTLLMQTREVALLGWEQYAVGNLFFKPDEETLQESERVSVTTCGVARVGKKECYRLGFGDD
jgi:hypothetical protein